ncbi:MAG TPA: hypothetical protein VIO61_14915 [Anaerolineaceae bacterium]
MRSNKRQVSLLFRMGERFLNRKLADTGISSGAASLLLDLNDGNDRSLVTPAIALGIDKAYITQAPRSQKQSRYVAFIPNVDEWWGISISLAPEGQVPVVMVEEASCTTACILVENRTNRRCRCLPNQPHKNTYVEF